MLRRTLLAATGVALAAPRLARAQSRKVLRFIPQADLAVLDPVWTPAYVTRHHAYLVFDTLYGLDAQMRVQPQMVAGHTIDDDSRRWTLTLREGLRFHNGEPVLARDCVASIRRWAQRDGFGRTLLTVTQELSAPDDRTIVFRLARPFPQLAYALAKTAANNCFMMPERIAATDAFTQITEMIGSGPFRFVASERIPGARVVYERFTDYVPRPDGEASFTAGPKRVYLDRVEWNVMPEAAAASGALMANEADWWELPPPDLLPLLKRDTAISVSVQDPTGYIGVMRLNHAQAPFNNAALRRAVLGAIVQSDFMQAAAGTDPNMWADGVGVFCPGTPMANAAGLEVITGPHGLVRSRDAVKASGYAGEKVVVLGATDLPILNGVAEVTVDLLTKLGLNVDYQPADWGTVVQRRTSKEPVDKGGWSVLSNFWSGMDQATPPTHALLASNGADAVYGWPNSPRIEELRAAWLDAPDLPAQQAIAAQLQAQAFQDVPYIPLGQYFYATAWRRGLTGMLGGFPLFWNLRAS